MQLLLFWTLLVFRPEMQQKFKKKDHECHLEMFYHYKTLFINQNVLYSLTFSTFFFGSVKTIKLHLYKMSACQF